MSFMHDSSRNKWTFGLESLLCQELGAGAKNGVETEKNEDKSSDFGVYVTCGEESFF